MNLPSNYQLKVWQIADPILWSARVTEDCSVPPMLCMDLLLAKFGGGKSQRLQTWERDPADPDGPHLIGVRTGTPMHVDPKYPRYTHQIVLLNTGVGVIGFDKKLRHCFEPGVAFCCDTHSPHQVIADPRLGMDKHYLAASMDAKEQLPINEWVPRLTAFIHKLRSSA